MKAAADAEDAEDAEKIRSILSSGAGRKIDAHSSLRSPQPLRERFLVTPASRRFPSSLCRGHAQTDARDGGSVQTREYRPTPRPASLFHAPPTRRMSRSECAT